MRVDGADSASEEMELLQGSTLFDSCAAALAKIHEVCGADAYSKIDVTGMTPKEAAAAYKKVAKKCAAAGKDVSASCGSKKPDDGSAAKTGRGEKIHHGIFFPRRGPSAALFSSAERRSPSDATVRPESGARANEHQSPARERTK